jgi:hypothetical protein
LAVGRTVVVDPLGWSMEYVLEVGCWHWSIGIGINLGRNTGVSLQMYLAAMSLSQLVERKKQCKHIGVKFLGIPPHGSNMDLYSGDMLRDIPQHLQNPIATSSCYANYVLP